MRGPRVALTFDTEHPDRPTEPGVTERLVDALAASDVRATFFLQGRWAEAYPTTARAIAAAGHRIGNHSHYHARMPLLTDTGIAEDIADAGRAILEATGTDPRPWFRCPFGAGMDDPRVLAAIADAGYRHAGWDVDVEDWAPDRDGRSVARDVLAGVDAHGDGVVVLLHGWPRATLEGIEAVIAGLRERAAILVDLDALDDVPGSPSWS